MLGGDLKVPADKVGKNNNSLSGFQESWATEQQQTGFCVNIVK